MKFRRKATQSAPVDESAAPAADEAVAPDSAPGPYSAAALSDSIDRIDLGGLLVAPVEGLDLRLQVNEKTEDVSAVMLASDDGALELHAYAAPSSGGLWDEVRPQIAADVERRGGQAEEVEGPFGTELRCSVPVQMADGAEGYQPSRIVGVERDRWLLRGTFLGRPALEPEAAEVWEHALRLVAVRRPVGAFPVGKELSLTLPPEAQRV